MATIANFTAWCVQNHWGYGFFSEATWAVIMIGIGSLLALLYVLRGNNIFIGFIVIWALFGIESKRRMTGDYGSESVITATLIGMGLIFAAIIIQLALRRRKELPEPQLFSRP